MRHLRPKLARPLYESLPWLYVGGGLGALVLSYRGVWPHLQVVLGLGGIAGLLGGSVVWLRRRGYRRLRARYARPDALADSRLESDE